MNAQRCTLCGRPIVDERGVTIVVTLEDAPPGVPDAEEMAAHSECVVLWGAGFGAFCDRLAHGDPATWDEDLAEYVASDLGADEQKALALYWNLRATEASA